MIGCDPDRVRRFPSPMSGTCHLDRIALAPTPSLPRPPRPWGSESACRSTTARTAKIGLHSPAGSLHRAYCTASGTLIRRTEVLIGRGSCEHHHDEQSRKKSPGSDREAI